MDNTPPPMHGQPYSNLMPPQTAGIAIASLVLGCLGIFTCGLTAIPAVICGHVALSRIGKSAGKLKGGGLAIGGLVTGYLTTVLLVISMIAMLAGVSLPAFAVARDRAREAQALNQLKQIGVACQAYAIDNGGEFPKKLEDLVPKYLPDARTLACPYPDPGKPVAFEYFGGKTTDAPDTVLADSPAVPGKGRVFLYVDGSATAKTRFQIERER